MPKDLVVESDCKLPQPQPRHAHAEAKSAFFRAKLRGLEKQLYGGVQLAGEPHEEQGTVAEVSVEQVVEGTLDAAAGTTRDTHTWISPGVPARGLAVVVC